MPTRQQGTGQDANDPAPNDPGTNTGYVSQPIGVPFYETDPRTGQPYVDARGNPVRWAAPVANTEDDLSFRGGRPGSRQFESTRFVPPRYFDGAQWLPGSLSPADVAALQGRMVTAGLLKPGTAQLGVWDPVSVTAYEKLLSFANASGLNSAQAMDRWGEAFKADPTQGRAPLVTKVTHPDDLRTMFRKAWMDTTGYGPDSATLDQMVSSFQGVEAGYQQQDYAMRGTVVDPNTGYQVDAGQGGTLTAPPDPSVFAATQARAADPVGAEMNTIIKQGGMLDAFKDMLDGWLVPG